MSVQVRLPAALRTFAGGQETVALEGRTVAETLEALFARHPALRRQLLNESGKLRNFVNLYLNDDDTRDLKGLSTPVKDGDVILIVPAIAGGADATPPCAPSGDALGCMGAPPAMAGTMRRTSPSLTGVASPLRSRVSSSFK